MGKMIDSAVKWIIGIADDNSHGYDQLNRWGPDYDCSSLVISAFEQAGVKVKTAGATFTGNMYNIFLKCGFKDVTSSINLSAGTGLKKGDVLLNKTHHTAMMISASQMVEASINEKGTIMNGKSGDQTGREIHSCGYYSYPWDCVLRYPESDEPAEPDKVSYVTYYVKAAVNYRTGPGVGNTIKGTYSKGTKVTAVKGVEQSINGVLWVKLKNGCWCCKNYLTTAKPGKSITEIAREVIAGKWGNGVDRVRRLSAAGYDYSAVQREVNKLLKG